VAQCACPHAGSSSVTRCKPDDQLRCKIGGFFGHFSLWHDARRRLLFPEVRRYKVCFLDLLNSFLRKHSGKINKSFTYREVSKHVFAPETFKFAGAVGCVKYSTLHLYHVLMMRSSKLVLGTKEASCGPDVQTRSVVKTFTTVITTGPTPLTKLNLITMECFETVPHLCYTYTIIGPYVPSISLPSPSLYPHPYQLMYLPVSTPTLGLDYKASSSFHRTGCGIHADCIGLKTSTEYRPKYDPCCDPTPTTTIPGPSPTCTQGCQVRIVGTVTSFVDSYEFFHPTSPATHSMFLPSCPFFTEEDYKLVRKTEVPQTATITLTTLQPRYIPLNTEAEEEQDTGVYPCTTTIRPLVSIHGGGTWTEYPNTYTKTETLDCVGCSVVVRPWGGPGPVVRYSATVTDLKTRTETTFVCKATS